MSQASVVVAVVKAAVFVIYNRLLRIALDTIIICSKMVICAQDISKSFEWLGMNYQVKFLIS